MRTIILYIYNSNLYLYQMETFLLVISVLWTPVGVSVHGFESDHRLLVLDHFLCFAL